MGWVFTEPAEFAELARPFLAEGAALGQQLMCVTAGGDACVAALAAAVVPHEVQIVSVGEIYGPSGLVDAGRQRSVFERALSRALAAGYTGIRVAADNTPLVADEQRLKAWMNWELTADRLMSQRPITGLCAFDGSKVDIDKLRSVATLHPLHSAAGPVPQYRMFSDSGNLCLEGEIDSSAVSQVWLALDVLPTGTGVLVDLARATLTSRAVTDGLAGLDDAGVKVTILAGAGPASAGG